MPSVRKIVVMLTPHELAQIIAALQLWRLHSEQEDHKVNEPAEIGLPLGDDFPPMTLKKIAFLQKKILAGIDDDQIQQLLLDIASIEACDEHGHCGNQQCEMLMTLSGHIRKLMEYVGYSADTCSPD